MANQLRSSLQRCCIRITLEADFHSVYHSYRRYTLMYESYWCKILSNLTDCIFNNTLDNLTLLQLWNWSGQHIVITYVMTKSTNISTWERRYRMYACPSVSLQHAWLHAQQNNANLSVKLMRLHLNTEYFTKLKFH